jgi:hypothetical protein
VGVGDVLIGMLPLMVSAALVPAPLIIVLTLLRGHSGLAAGAAFLVGMTVVRIAQGALFGFVLVDAMGADGRAEPRPVVATLLLILGLLLWITAVKTLLKEEDPDAPPPKWLERLRTASPLAAFGIGAGFIAIAAKQWVFTLGALGVIAEANLDRSEATIAYLLFVLGATSLVLLPVLASAVARDQAAAILERVGTWLERNNRGIKIVVSVVFGTYFLWKGLSGLLG